MERRTLVIGGVVVALLLIAASIYAALHYGTKTPAPIPAAPAPVATTSPTVVIGHSVQGRDITATTYGTGPTHLLFAGGMHGGYEWNAVLVAYDLMDYLAANPSAIPANESVTVVPDINPDATFKVIGKEGRFALADVPANAGAGGVGRLNADNVDLNRNFDCHWAATSTWQGKPESAGTTAFSEPEARAIRDVVASIKPVAVAFWHSASGTVYASECGNGPVAGDLAAMTAYAKAAGYKTQATFDAYPITGDSEGWLASIGIPAITVELTTHSDVEWDKNLAGTLALLKLYAATSTRP